MRLYVSIRKGLLTFQDFDLPTVDGRHPVVGEFKCGDYASLSAFLRPLIEAGWDGHFTVSSSMNWPEEDGWPEGHDPYAMLRSCIRSASTPDVEPAKRAETGNVQFGDDWPGVFMRGKHAAPDGFLLSQFLAESRMLMEDLSRQSGKKPDVMLLLNLSQMDGLAKTLLGSQQSEGQQVVKLKPWHECLADAKTAETVPKSTLLAAEADLRERDESIVTMDEAKRALQTEADRLKAENQKLCDHLILMHAERGHAVDVSELASAELRQIARVEEAETKANALYMAIAYMRSAFDMDREQEQKRLLARQNPSDNPHGHFKTASYDASHHIERGMRLLRERREALEKWKQISIIHTGSHDPKIDVWIRNGEPRSLRVQISDEMLQQVHDEAEFRHDLCVAQETMKSAKILLTRGEKLDEAALVGAINRARAKLGQPEVKRDDDLTKAVVRFIETIDRDFAGYLPAAMNAVADVCEREGWAYERGIVGNQFAEAVSGVSR